MVFLEIVHVVKFHVLYYFPKFLDRKALANSADHDQTAPRVGSALFASFGGIDLYSAAILFSFSGDYNHF